MATDFYRHDPKSPHVKRQLEGLKGPARKKMELFLNFSALLIGPTNSAKAESLTESLLNHGADNLIHELERIVREYRK